MRELALKNNQGVPQSEEEDEDDLIEEYEDLSSSCYLYSSEDSEAQDDVKEEDDTPESDHKRDGKDGKEGKEEGDSCSRIKEEEEAR